MIKTKENLDIALLLEDLNEFFGDYYEAEIMNGELWVTDYVGENVNDGVTVGKFPVIDGDLETACVFAKRAFPIPIPASKIG